MPRISVTVDYVKDRINTVLREGRGGPEHRKGMIDALELMLHQTGYKGYRYLTHKEVPLGERPGINVDADGILLEHCDPWDLSPRFANTDPTRVQYH